MGDGTNSGERVFFRIIAPEASEVCIGGDFNGWNAQKHALKRRPGGFWEKTITLEPGRHEYKFKIDGDWFIDSFNNKVCENTFGTWNNFIEVFDREKTKESEIIIPICQNFSL